VGSVIVPNGGWHALGDEPDELGDEPDEPGFKPSAFTLMSCVGVNRLAVKQ
jgi:hypothetical protein